MVWTVLGMAVVIAGYPSRSFGNGSTGPLSPIPPDPAPN
jgi:hypothetical protein